MKISCHKKHFNLFYENARLYYMYCIILTHVGNLVFFYVKYDKGPMNYMRDTICGHGDFTTKPL